MRTYRGYVATLAGTFALVALLALASHSRVESQGQRPDTPVVVNNAADAPIPVTGTVDIGDVEGTIQAEQSGAWSVDVDSLPAVQQGGIWNVGVTDLPAVQQGGAWSVDVDSLPAVQQGGPWNVGISGTPTVNLGAGNSVNIGNTSASPVPVQMVGGGQPFNGWVRVTLPDGISSRQEFISLPPGKALVIEHIMLRGWYRNNQHVRPVLVTGDALGTYLREFSTTTVFDSTVNLLYATGSHPARIYTTGVGLNLGRNHTDGEAIMDLVVGGFLVDL